MKISTMTRYGLRAMIDLANHKDEKYVLLKDIARRQNISERYLENIMRILVSAGLVISSRGKGGGFTLMKSPENIRLIDIIKNLEGDLSPVPCVSNPSFCDRVNVCVTHELWENMKELLYRFFESKTLQDLVEAERRKMKEGRG